MFVFFREMLERALVKRIRESDSDSESPDENTGKEQPKKQTTEKPTDILTTDKGTDIKVHRMC